MRAVIQKDYRILCLSKVTATRKDLTIILCPVIGIILVCNCSIGGGISIQRGEAFACVYCLLIT